MSVAAISFVSFLLAGFFNLFGIAWLSIPIGLVCTVVFLLMMKNLQAKRQ
jgi:hypothetical protein